MKQINQETTTDDIMNDPAAYGLPTFEEYRKRKTHYREKFFGRDDDEIASIDRGDPELGLRQKYFIVSALHRYHCESLEQVERIAKEMGLNLFKDFKVDPQVKPDDRGFYTEVTFRPKQKSGLIL